MTKDSRQMIAAAKKALSAMMQRAIEKGIQPSFLEMFYEGYMEGLMDTFEDVDVRLDRLKEWNYIELTGNPPSDDRCLCLIKCHVGVDTVNGWYEQENDTWSLEYTPSNFEKVLAWHMLPTVECYSGKPLQHPV